MDASASSNGKYLPLAGSDGDEGWSRQDSADSKEVSRLSNPSRFISQSLSRVISVVNTVPGTPVEASLSIAVQVFPTFLVAGFGMVAAGLLLGLVQYWRVFREVQEILVLVPALLGLKGNLEMTLASRLGTHANLGDLDGGKFFTIICGNLAVVQCQAIVVGFLAAVVAVSTDSLFSGSLSISHALLLASSAISAASIAGGVLACVMVLIVLISRRWGINPDNVSAPIAGMLGDFCTLGLLSTFASLLWASDEWIQWAVLVVYLFFAPICAWIAFHNRTEGPLRESWQPVIVSMLISCVAGFILKNAIRNFTHLAPFAPVMNGAGGNLAAVHASRLSTDLHASEKAHGVQGPRTSTRHFSKLGLTIDELRDQERQNQEQQTRPTGVYRQLSWYEPTRHKGFCITFVTFMAIRGPGGQARTARTLSLLTIPGSLCFAPLIVGAKSEWSAWPEPIFLAVYVGAALFQVTILLNVAHLLVSWLWSKKVDPDNAAIPYVTSLGDVVGTASLTAAFSVLAAVGAEPWHDLTAPSVLKQH